VDSQLFLYIYLALGAALLIWFMSGLKNRGHKPTRLSMRNPTTELPPEPPPPSKAAVKKDYSKATTEKPNTSKARVLNVLFLYNGHDWDAYEVLGIPAGASLPLVTEKYQKLVQEALDQGQREFYEAAYQAILKKF
jgi:hypothetical protein